MTSECEFRVPSEGPASTVIRDAGKAGSLLLRSQVAMELAVRHEKVARADGVFRQAVHLPQQRLRPRPVQHWFQSISFWPFVCSANFSFLDQDDAGP
jgi:hypothetical protein